MKNTMSLLLAVSLLLLLVIGCNFNTTSEKESNKPAKTPSNSDNDSKSSKSDKPKLSGSEKPDGSGKSAKKDNPVPSDWIYLYDEQKGYGFYLPEGSTGEEGTFNGVKLFEGSTPAPSELGFAVIAFKDRRMTKDDLIDIAVKYLEDTGETVNTDDLTTTAESDDYTIATVTTMMDGKKGKARILVGTDVTDNYILVIGGDAARFDANEELIDEVWGSFEMWSGGASNN